MGSAKASDYKAIGGKLVRVRLTEEDGRVESVQISGDFFLVPEESLGKLEELLQGVALQESDIRALVDRFFAEAKTQTLGVSSDDLVRAILSATEEVVVA